MIQVCIFIWDFAVFDVKWTPLNYPPLNHNQIILRGAGEIPKYRVSGFQQFCQNLKFNSE